MTTTKAEMKRLASILLLALVLGILARALLAGRLGIHLPWPRAGP